MAAPKVKQASLTTKKVHVIPLLPEQIQLYLEDPKALYQELEITPDNSPRDRDFEELLRTQYEKMQADPEFNTFHTVWMIVEQEEKHFVGYIYFLGRPSETGMVEADGAIRAGYRRKGYMLDAATIVRQWAFARKDVIMMLSYCSLKDEPKRKLLTKLGFGNWTGQHPAPEGYEVYCSEKPVRTYSRIGMLLGFGIGIAIGLILKVSALLMGLAGMTIGVVVCSYFDGKSSRERYQILVKELEASGVNIAEARAKEEEAAKLAAEEARRRKMYAEPKKKRISRK